MADDFDPYYTWLAIPPEEQPADHYRLLGIRRFESNADVITNAMDQRMHYLRSLQVGKRSALSQRILNEVSAAGVILLDPKRRAEYDLQLRSKESVHSASSAPPVPLPPGQPGSTTPNSPKAARPLPVAASLPQAGPLPASSPKPAVAPIAVIAPSRRTGSATSRSPWTSPVVLGGVAFAAVAMLGLVGVVILRSMQSPDGSVVRKGGDGVDQPPGSKQVAGSKQGRGEARPREQAGDKKAVSNRNPAADRWWNDSPSREQLHVLSFGRQDSVEIEQSAEWVPLTRGATIEGWFKLQLESPQTMSLLGTRRGGSSGNVPQGWQLMARRGVVDGQIGDQLMLEVCKSDGTTVVHSAALPAAGEWHHVALVVAASKELTVFLDGKVALRLPATSDVSVSGGNLRLGDDANLRGNGMIGQFCGFRISDSVRYQQPFNPPSPLSMVHDASTAMTLHFTIAVPNAVSGTVRRSAPDWKYGYGRFDEQARQVADFAPLRSWNGLQWRSGPEVPQQVAEWMSLDPLGGHTGNGSQYAVIRRWTAPREGELSIAGRLTHAHETQFGDGIRALVVSSSAGEISRWDARFTSVETTVDKIQVRQGDRIDFVVECKATNHCDKFAWPVKLTLAAGDGAAPGTWDSEKDFHGPQNAGAIYQLAQLPHVKWARLDPSSQVSLLQLAPIAATTATSTAGRIDLIQASFERRNVGRGAVSRSGDSIRVENAPTAFTLPFSFPSEYTLEAEVVRLDGEESICFGIPIAGNRRLTAIVDGAKGTLSGLASINDRQIFTPNNPLVYRGRLLTNGQPAIVQIRVSKTGVELVIDGSSISKWTETAEDKVTVAKGMGYPDAKALAILTWNAPYLINRLELFPTGGGTESQSPQSTPQGRMELVKKHSEKIERVRGQLTYSGASGWRTSGNTAFMVPESMPSEYILEAEVIREEGTGSISFHLPVGGSPLSAIIDIYDARLTGLSNINDWHIQSADNPTVHRGPVLSNGRPAQVRIVVSKQEISLSVDGKKLSAWPYDPAAKLVAYQGLRLPDPLKLGITTGNSGFRIRRLDLLTISGAATPLSPPSAAGPQVYLVDGSQLPVRSLEGSYQVEGKVLTTGTDGARFVLDAVELPEEYTVEAEIARIAGNETLGLGFYVQRRPLSVLIDGWGSSRSGICLLPGQNPSSPDGPTIQQRQLLTNGRPANFRLSVSRQEVVLSVDDREIARWPNDPQADLRAFGGYEPIASKLTITARPATSYRIANLRLTPGSGNSTSPSGSPPTGISAVKRAPLPDAAAKANALSQLNAAFGDELKAAKTPPAKAALAKRISDLARDTKDLPARYVMFEEARRLFVELKDVSSALDTIEVVGQDFDVEVLPAKVKLLETLAEGNPSAAQRSEIVSAACTLGYEAIDSDHLELAKAVANIARSAAARATGQDVKLEAKEFADEFAVRYKRWEAVRKAEQTLAAMPDDPAANLAAGLYHLFDRGDQRLGLAMLVKGSDPKLAAAAQARERSLSQGLSGSLAEADAWFDGISSVPAEYKAAVQQQSLDAYELAIASAEGLEKAKAEKRRDQLKADLAGAPPKPGSNRSDRIRKLDLPETSRGLVGRVYLSGRDAGVFITFNPERAIDRQKLRDLLTEARVPGGRLVLEGFVTCPTAMSFYVTHRGAASAATQQLLVNGKVLSTVGGNRNNYDSERLQLAAGNHLIQWAVEFDGSVSPSIHFTEEGNGRPVPVSFNRDQHYGARKLPTKVELDLSN